jgi:hypothetical protein
MKISTKTEHELSFSKDEVQRVLLDYADLLSMSGKGKLTIKTQPHNPDEYIVFTKVRDTKDEN